jgi:ADP-ribosylglycohydrolase
VSGVLLLAYKYFGEGIGEALIVNANIGGDSCHRGALLGAVLGAAGQALPPHLGAEVRGPLGSTLGLSVHID